MKTKTLEEVLWYNLPGEEPYSLYRIRGEADDILYVGQASSPHWRIQGHVFPISKRFQQHQSDIGKYVKNHYPESLSWKIDFLRVSDCLGEIREQFPDIFLYDLPYNKQVDLAEKALIRHDKPRFNKVYRLKRKADDKKNIHG